MVPSVAADQGRNGGRLELSSRVSGKSRSDFIAKLTTAEEEADEACYWLELLVACQAFPTERVRSLLQEANELTAIFVTSIKTARANRRESGGMVTCRSPGCRVPLIVPYPACAVPRSRICGLAGSRFSS